MQNLKFSIEINAPREKVWNAMLGERSFREWTQPFAPGSHYKGSWKKGSKILFLAPGKTGEMEGMVSRIRESKPFEYISIEHLGVVQDGEEVTESDAIKDWVGAREKYIFREKEGKTQLLVVADTNDEFKEMFQGVWPRALKKLKEISEKQNGNGTA